MNKQREVIYGMRRQILDGESQETTVAEWREDLVVTALDTYAPSDAHPEDWDLAGLGEALFQQFDVRIPADELREIGSRDSLQELVTGAVQERYAAREAELGVDIMRALERHAMLAVIDQQWKDHLLSIDHLKEGIGLRGYGQRDPLMEYKKEAFDLFQDMTERVKAAVVERLFKIQVVAEAPPDMPVPRLSAAREIRPETPGAATRGASTPAPSRSSSPSGRTAAGAKIGRNDPCYCGSGKKYKKCCYLKGA
jgi:preprotein translocase subunit SecA